MDKSKTFKEIKASHDLLQRIEELESLCYQMKSMVDNLPSDVYWKNTDGIWVGLNQRCAQNLYRMGFIKVAAESEVVGKTDYQIFNKSTADGYRKNDLAVLNHKAEITIEEKTTLATGENITLLSTKKPIFDKNGNISGIMGNTIDITYLKNIEAELIDAKNAAEAGNRAKDEFIRNMSHDIRTPLSGVIGMSSILENEANTIKAKEYAHMVNVSGEQLLSLLNSVLDIVAAGSNKESQINLSQIKIRELINSITDLELPTIKMKKLDLRVMLDRNLPELIEIDAIKVHRILLNLLSNAVKFTDHGYVEIGARLINENVIEFYIRDSGPGIKNEDQKKIFKKFFRGTASYQGIYTGYGVGLHIVKKYMQLLKGKISVASSLNEGTTITASIPVNIIKQSPSEFTSALQHKKTTEVNQSNNSHLNILLIEDNAIALKTAENIIKKMGISFHSATNGVMAIELLKKNSFHLVLSDIGLPDISGFDVVRHFRFLEKEDGRIRTPVIGLTAHSVQDTEQEALQSGMNEVLSKPLRPEYINDLIKKYDLHQNLATEDVKKIETPRKNLTRHDLPENAGDMFQLEQFALLDEQLGMENCGGFESLKELLGILINFELPGDKEKMQEAFRQKNYADVEKLAHKIKGGAVYVGTVRMKYACQYVERYWKTGERELFDTLYHQAISVIDETYRHINIWLDKQ